MIDNVYVLFLCVVVTRCATRINRERQNICDEVPEKALEKILGPAFNPRYMSVNIPSAEKTHSSKRRTGYDLDFQVDGQYEDDFDNRPAWTVTNHVEDNMNQLFGEIRRRRDAGYLQEWQCKHQVVWQDLGPNYFPRYLRSVECLTQSCWFNLYTCRPKSFTVKILKRRPECVRVRRGAFATFYDDDDDDLDRLPKELRELWVWEERAVSFCCDCAA